VKREHPSCYLKINSNKKEGCASKKCVDKTEGGSRCCTCRFAPVL